MEMVDVDEISYWEIFLTEYGGFFECEHFLGKKTLCSLASLVSGINT